MKMDPKTLAHRFGVAQTKRRRVEPQLDDVLRHFAPTRGRFQDRTGEEDTDLYDETGPVTLGEFSARFHQGATPTYSQWALLEADKSVPAADRDAVNKDLAEIREYAFEVIQDSNFVPEAGEFYQDLGMSTGVMTIEDGGANRILRHKTHAAPEIYLEAGAFGEIAGIFRQRSVELRFLPEMYPHGEFSPDLEKRIATEGEKPVELVDYMHHGQSTLKTTTHAWLPQTKEIINFREASGLGSSPFVTARMSCPAGELYGRGPATISLAAVKTVNQVIEFLLQHAAISLVPPFQYDHDGTIAIENVQLMPGVGIPRMPGSRGIEPLNFQGNPQLSDIILGDQRTNIRRAMFNDMLADPGKTPATAYEISERMADLAQRMAAPFGRVQLEFLVPYMRRVLWLLEKRGDIALPRIRGKQVKVRVVSPLALAQEHEELRALMQEFQYNSSIFGPQLAALNYRPEETRAFIRERTGSPARLHRSDAEFKAEIEKMQQMMAQQQGMAA